MNVLSAVLKRGKRQELLDKVPSIYKTLMNMKTMSSSSSSSVHRKLFIKLVQRIGLVYLKPKIASWRYKRGTIN